MSWCGKPWTEREHTFFFTGLYKSCGLHRHFIFDPWRASSLYAFVPFGIIQQMLHTHTSYRCTGSLERCLWLHSYLLNEAANIIYPLIKCLFVRVKTNSEQVILYALYPNIKQTKEKIACSEFTHSPRSPRRHFLYETDMKQSSYSQYDECLESQAAFKRNQKAAKHEGFLCRAAYFS